MSWRLKIVGPPGTLRNDQQMIVSKRTAAVRQISPYNGSSLSALKERVVEYARHHGMLPESSISHE